MNSLSAEKVRILYVGSIGPRNTGSFRIAALKRLGHNVRGLDLNPYLSEGGPLRSRIRYRALIGSTVSRYNRDVLAAVADFCPDLVWFEKASFAWRKTIFQIRARGIFTIHQNDDDPFGPRRDPGWRLILEALPEYDLHLLPRRVSLEEYRNAGARDVFWFIPAHESTFYPPPESWSDVDRTIDVSFIGFPHDKRPRYMRELWERHGIRTLVWGDSRWGRGFPRAKLPAEVRRELYQGGSLTYDQFRETIWRSRINLGFCSNLNRDEFSGRSFQIPASGGFLLAEDTPGHREMFTDGQEAVFFNSIDDCAEKIRRYLPDEEARLRIAKAGQLRSAASGYDYDSRVAEVLKYIRIKERQVIPVHGRISL